MSWWFGMGKEEWRLPLSADPGAYIFIASRYEPYRCVEMIPVRYQRHEDRDTPMLEIQPDV